MSGAGGQIRKQVAILMDELETDDNEAWKLLTRYHKFLTKEAERYRRQLRECQKAKGD